MNPHDPTYQLIEEGERWMRCLPWEVDPGSVAERVKVAVRLELGDQWLKERSAVEPDPAMLTSVKAAVRRELAVQAQRIEPWRNALPAHSGIADPAGGRGRGLLYRVFSTSAVAASLLLATGLGFRSAARYDDEQAALRQVRVLTGLVSRELDEEETEWEAIEAVLSSLRRSFAEAPVEVWVDDALDELDDDIDDLMRDFDVDEDVS